VAELERVHTGQLAELTLHNGTVIPEWRPPKVYAVGAWGAALCVWRTVLLARRAHRHWRGE